MAIVTAEVFYWHETGMKRYPPPHGGHPETYITVREAERLLQEAHARGYNAGIAAAREVIRAKEKESE